MLRRPRDLPCSGTMRLLRPPLTLQPRQQEPFYTKSADPLSAGHLPKKGIGGGARDTLNQKLYWNLAAAGRKRRRLTIAHLLALFPLDLQTMFISIPLFRLHPIPLLEPDFLKPLSPHHQPRQGMLPSMPPQLPLPPATIVTHRRRRPTAHPVTPRQSTHHQSRSR